MTEKRSLNGEITRREFCNCLVATSAGLLVTSTALASKSSGQQKSTLTYPAFKIEGADRLVPGSSLNFTYPNPNDPAILVRSVDGEYYAHEQKCSHKGCSVYYERAGSRLKCPCHRGAFDAESGNVLFGPPTRPLNMIVLEMRAGGEVWAVGRSIRGG